MPNNPNLGWTEVCNTKACIHSSRNASLIDWTPVYDAAKGALKAKEEMQGSLSVLDACQEMLELV